MESAIVVTLVTLVVLVGIAWGVALWIKHAASKHPPVAPEKYKLSGVGGWLLLLTLGLMLLGPLTSVGRINSDFMTTEATYPALKGLAVWSTYKTATWWVTLFVCGASFYAGLGLVRKRTRAVVNRAQVLLWVIGPVASIVLGVVIPALVLPTSAGPGSQFLGALIVSAIGAGIWSTYLSRSKRVAATYGDRDGVGMIAWAFYFLLPKRER